MGKNLTIYLPNGVAKKMQNFPEVNWSEICRKAVADYVETRSEADLAPILERLKEERSEDFKQGQLVMYTQIIPIMAWKDFEFLYPRLSITLKKEQPLDPFLGEQQPISEETAERDAVLAMRIWLKKFGGEHEINVPWDLGDAYAEGAIEAFWDLYNKTKKQKQRTEKHGGK
jgi:hypothetical protein